MLSMFIFFAFAAEKSEKWLEAHDNKSCETRVGKLERLQVWLSTFVHSMNTCTLKHSEDWETAS